ncbi:MAG: AAA family ATPase [Schleiferiaceae bacterium]|nr:AAA family ATPase [Schleiferiaceae bacterium]
MTDNQVIATLEQAPSKLSAFKKEVAKVIVGQQEAVDLITQSILVGGHSLLVGVPGLAKTLLVTTVSKALGLDFARIQFTPDLMPTDITGTEVLTKERSFEFRKGPVFANVVLADEINRTPPKTQAALLEAMQEKRVSVGGVSYDLPQPFFVLATQNPIEQEGTYPLPEAQLDRFLFNITVGYPSQQEEQQVVKQTTISHDSTIEQVFTAQEIIDLQTALKRLPVVDETIDYAVSLVRKTRPGAEGAHPKSNEYLNWGAGPRASQNLILAAKAVSIMYGAGSPTIEHVKSVAKPILRHRIVVNYKAKAEGLSADDIIDALL